MEIQQLKSKVEKCETTAQTPAEGQSTNKEYEEKIEQLEATVTDKESQISKLQNDLKKEKLMNAAKIESLTAQLTQAQSSLETATQATAPSAS
jgi:predicted RNase H-like nuclease (RuvC/YqgF family)